MKAAVFMLELKSINRLEAKGTSVSKTQNQYSIHAVCIHTIS